MEDNGQPKSTLLSFAFNLSHNLTQLCLGGVIFSSYVLFLTNLNIVFSSSFRQHIILCVLGYVILMTQAVLAFSPFGWASHLKYELRRYLHLGMQITGCIFVVSGSIVRMGAVNNSFSTPHGIFGILAMILAMLTAIGGVVGFFMPKLNNKLMKISHACLGVLTISFAFTALIIGFHNTYRVFMGDGNANFSIILTVLALVGTLLSACIKNVKRLLN